MLDKILSIPGKLRNHLLTDGWKESCDICLKIETWIEIFVNYEKENNKTLDISQIMDENFVEKIFFSDNIMKIEKK